MKSQARISLYLYTFAGALLLMGVAIFNGYPLVYSDTGTYLASGFELETPFDRPINYGIFIRLSSLNGLSLWLTSGLQCLILSYLLRLSFRDLSQARRPKRSA